MNIKYKRNYSFSLLLILCSMGWSGVGARQAQGTQLQNGLINYWRFNEGTGTTLTDANLAGATVDNGTLRNSPTWLTGADGKFNAGLQFSGSNVVAEIQDVLLPTGGDMDFGTSGVTLSAWVKLDQLPSQIDAAFSFSSILDSAQDNYVLYLDKANDELRFKATNASGVSTLAAQHPGVRSSLLNTTDWIHVMGVFDGDKGRAKMYFNGQLVDVTTQASTVTVTLAGSTVRTGQIAAIGSQPNATTTVPTTPFKGKISDVAIWNRPLGAAEAQYLYNGGTGRAVGAANPDIAALPPVSPLLPVAQPVVYYKFDGNLNNSGTGGATYNAILHDFAGRNDTLYTAETPYGQALDLRENPLSTASTVGGDYLSVDYTLTNSGTIATRFTASALANFVTLWSNSLGIDEWESWVYGDGRIAARAKNGTPIVASSIFLQADPTASQHIAFTWQRETTDPTKMLVRLYVNGEWLDERRGDWVDPGATFFIAGGVVGTGSNHLGTGVYDEFRIYNAALSEAEVLYLSQNAPAVTALQGDYNLDGKVNGADYVVWRNGGSPDSTQAGYNLWRQNFGTGSGAGSGGAAAVPEPASVGLGLIGLTALSLRPRKVRSR